MNLQSEILRENSRRNSERIARWIGPDAKRFALLMELLLNGERRTAQLASNIMGKCTNEHPELIMPWLKPLIKKMQEQGVHGAIKRNTIRSLQCVEIPRALQGKVASLCFDYLGSPDEPIAVRVFAMTVLANISDHEPELKHELQVVIEQMIPHGTAAFRARARMVLQKLENTPTRSRSTREPVDDSTASRN